MSNPQISLQIQPHYQSALRDRLARHKRDVLGIKQDGVWEANGRPYPHVLPAHLRNLNLLEPLRARLLAYLAAQPEITLHRYFHHLTSSQAMCLNLLAPALFRSSIWARLESQIDAGIELIQEGAAFEKVFDRSEGTNFDFYCRRRGGGVVYFEFKLAEEAYGSAVRDARHLAKLQHIYLPRLKGRVTDRVLEPGWFFRHYQLLRNLSYLADERDRLVLVLPRAHTTLMMQVDRFLDTIGPTLRAQVQVIAMEDLASALLADPHQQEAGPEFAQLRAFIDKYCLTQWVH